MRTACRHANSGLGHAACFNRKTAEPPPSPSHFLSLSLTSFSIVLKLSTSWQASCQTLSIAKTAKVYISPLEDAVASQKVISASPQGARSKNRARSSSVSASPLVIKLDTCRSTHPSTRCRICFHTFKYTRDGILSTRNTAIIGAAWM